MNSSHNDEARENPGQDPAPLEHADAERVTSEEGSTVPDADTEATQIDENPSANPRDPDLRDVKGG